MPMHDDGVDVSAYDGTSLVELEHLVVLLIGDCETPLQLFT